jgi:drug/metabolite transporter (DMT)-like permease
MTGSNATGDALEQKPLAGTYALVILTTLIFGGQATAGKIVVQSIPPITGGVLRYGLAALVLVVVFRADLRRLVGELRGRDLWLLAGIGVTGTTLLHVTFFYGVTLAPATHGAVITPTISTLCAMMIAAKFADERVDRLQLLGICVSTVGIVLVVQPSATGGRHAEELLVGDVLFVVGGVSFGVYAGLSRIAMRRFSPHATVASGMTIGCLLLVVLALLFEDPWRPIATASTSTWIALSYLAIPGSVFAFVFWNLAIKRLGAGRTSVFLNLVPVFGVALAWSILDERLGALQVVGGALAVLGVWLSQHTGRSAQARPPTSPRIKS